VTTSNGIPIGPPFHVPEPKSACRPVSRPIERTIVVEFAATGSLSTRWFKAFERGKTAHRGAAGRRSAAADPGRTAIASTAARRAALRITALYRP
jgi:hypothetical protein